MDNNNLIKSDLDYINSQMEQLSIKTDKSCEFHENNKSIIVSSKDNNMLYEDINMIISKYNRAQTQIMQKLKHEAEFIKQTGETYHKLDMQMKDEANRL